MARDAFGVGEYRIGKLVGLGNAGGQPVETGLVRLLSHCVEPAIALAAACREFLARNDPSRAFEQREVATDAVSLLVERGDTALGVLRFGARLVDRPPVGRNLGGFRQGRRGKRAQVGYGGIEPRRRRGEVGTGAGELHLQGLETPELDEIRLQGGELFRPGLGVEKMGRAGRPAHAAQGVMVLFHPLAGVAQAAVEIRSLLQKRAQACEIGIARLARFEIGQGKAQPPGGILEPPVVVLDLAAHPGDVLPGLGIHALVRMGGGDSGRHGQQRVVDMDGGDIVSQARMIPVRAPEGRLVFAQALDEGRKPGLQVRGLACQPFELRHLLAFAVDLADDRIEPLQHAQVLQASDILLAPGEKARKFRLQFALLGDQLLPVAGSQLALTLGLAGLLVRIEHLVEQPVARTARRVDTIRLRLQPLPEVGKPGEPGRGGEKQAADLAAALQHAVAAGAQRGRVQPEGALEDVPAERAEKGRQRVVGQARLRIARGKKRALAALAPAKLEASPAPRGNACADPKARGVAAETVGRPLRESEQEI